jgi:hypothetical protein
MFAIMTGLAEPKNLIIRDSTKEYIADYHYSRKT